MIKKTLVFLIILLLLSVESSLQTSIIWNRSIAWTPWLYKIGFFSIADIIIILVSIFTIIRLLRKSIIPRSGYLAICLIAFIYLFIGLIYNIGVFTFWKTYFYDFKVVLYLTVPYLFLYSIKGKEKVIKWFTPKRIFIYAAIAALIDLAIVNIWGRVEYPSNYGLPVIPSLLPISVSIVGILYARKFSLKILFLILLFLEIINSMNRLSFGILFVGIAAILYISVLRLNVNRGVRFMLILSALLIVNVSYVILLPNPLNISLLSKKKDGAVTRQIQLENVLSNFDKNIPGIIGKGLGSTWFVYTPIPEMDIYSVGTSVGKTSKEAMSMPVQFIFNSTPPSLLYKWGIVGSILLVFFITAYFHKLLKGIQELKRYHLDKDEERYLYAVLLISILFILDNFTYIGILKSSLVTSLLAFCAEHNIQLRLTEFRNMKLKDTDAK